MTLAASFVHGGEGLLGLHEALRADGFVVGPGELLAATRLIVQLQKSGRLPAQVETLESLLRAVYCKSADEQDRFGAVFKRWLEQRKPIQKWDTQSADSGPAAEAAAAPPAAAPPRTNRLKAAMVAVGIAAAAGWWMSHEFRVAEAPPPSAAPAEKGSAVPGAAPAQQTALPAIAVDQRSVAEGLTGYMPVQRRQREYRPWVVFLLLALPLPLLLLFYAPALALSRRHGERTRQGARVSLDVSDWRAEAERMVPAMDLNAAARLDRHVRPAFDEVYVGGRRMLDLPHTLAATLRRHGALTLRWRPRRARPSYLVLIDVRDEHDLRGRLFFRWGDRLRREGVAVDIWLFDSDPRTLFPADRRRVIDALGRVRNAVRFEQVASRAATDSVHRLLVVGDGAGFFAEGARLNDWWTTLGWERWRDRVLFTPADSREWGEREVAIEQPLGRGDPGFLVLPLEQEALNAYAVQLTTGHLPSIVLASGRRFPSVIERLPQRGVGAEPPPAEDIERLMTQLRLYLGENGLRWLAACALPPLTRWELTLLIGQALFRELGADTNDKLDRLMASNYPRLARLPWLREAHLPDWLALRLLHELSPAVQERIRSVVRMLLEGVPAEDARVAGDVLMLDCSPPSAPAGTTPTAPGGPSAGAARVDRRRREWLYMGFLDGLSPRQLALRAPREWRALFTGASRFAPHAHGWQRLGVVAFDWMRALAARLMWREGHAGSGAAARPLWAAAAWFVTTLAVLWLLARQPMDALGPAAEQALFTERDIAVGAVSELPFHVLGFSGDGKRFVLAEANGEVQVRSVDAPGQAIGPAVRVPGQVVGAHLDQAGEKLVSVTSDGNVARWDVRSGSRLELPFSIPRQPVWKSRATSDGALVLVHAGINDVAVVKPAERTTIELRMQSDASDRDAHIQTAFVDMGGKPAVVLLQGKHLGVFDTVGSEPVTQTVLPTSESARLSPDGRHVAIQSGEASLAVLELAYTQSKGDVVRQKRPVIDTALSSAIVQVSFAPGAPRVALALANGEVRVWDLVEGTLLGAVRPAASEPREIWLAPGGRALLVSTEEGELIAYNVDRPLSPAESAAADARLGKAAVAGAVAGIAAFAPLGAPLAQSDLVMGVAISPDGARLLTATAREVRLWEQARLQVRSLEGERAGPPQRVVAAAPDGRRGASGGEDGSIVVWNTASDAVEARFAQHGGAATALAFNVSGTLLAGGSSDGMLRLWDARHAAPVGEARHGAAVEQVEFDRAGHHIVTVGGGRARLWRVGEHTPEPGAAIEASGVVAAQFSATDGGVLLTVGSDGVAALWDVESGASLRDTRAPAARPNLQRKSERPIVVASIEPRLTGLFDGDAMLLANDSKFPSDRRAPPENQRERDAGQKTRGGPRCVEGSVPRAAFDGDTACVTPAVREQVRQDNAARRERIDPVNRAFGAETCRQGFVWREADRYLRGERFTDKVCVLPAQRDQAARDNDRRASRQVDERAQAPAAEAAMALRGGEFVGEGRLVLVFSADRARLYDAQDLRPRGEVLRHAGLVQARYLQRDGLVATAARDGVVRFWDPDSGIEIGPPLFHGASLTQMKSTQDGRYLATADLRGQVRVWDVSARLPLPGSYAHLPAGAAPRSVATAAIALDADGRYLVSSGSDGRARSVLLPPVAPGTLRVVRPFALFWLAVFGVLMAACWTSAALAAHRRGRTLTQQISGAVGGEAELPPTASAQPAGA